MYSMQAKFIKKFALSQNFRIFGCCGEIRSAPFATTFARITSASCAAASRTSHNKQICKILKSRTSSDLELHKSARTMWQNPLRSFCHIGSADYIRRCCSSLRELRTSVNLLNPKNGSKLPSRDFANPPNRYARFHNTVILKKNLKLNWKMHYNFILIHTKK